MLTTSTISMIHCFVLMLTYLSWHLLNQHMYLCWLILPSFTVSVQWKRLPTSNEPPPPRAYHSMTSIGSRFLLFGGFDGKNTFGDLWWLVPEDDPIAKRDLAPNIDSNSKPSAVTGDNQQSNLTESQALENPITELAQRLGIPLSEEVSASFVDEVNDKELVELSSRLAGQSLPASDQVASIQVLHEHWKSSPASSLQLQELGPLLRDYQRLILRRYSYGFTLQSSLCICYLHT
ncbi:unnamed protein product [Miscanthus lutarioriparius]|uniref:Uncharacterized protein n=1 Tax=Miscanthus lutarioriparius TaxID=422564 RepID=A0A811MZG8_9POAL|nr:unnamed protein product [Miscanthus lutarioriparius]